MRRGVKKGSRMVRAQERRSGVGRWWWGSSIVGVRCGRCGWWCGSAGDGEMGG
jgi:hypothetical protein